MDAAAVRIELDGNTKSFGPVYVTVQRAVEGAQGGLVQRSYINEVESPWRHGRGLLVRLTRQWTFSVGRWWPTTEERPGYLAEEEPAMPLAEDIAIDADPTDAEIAAALEDMEATHTWDPWSAERAAS